MANITVPYKNNFSGTVGAGIGALVAPSDRKYFILEHKVSSKYHHSGENQKIIVDQILIGRDPECQVRFDDSFAIVSRRHAAIVKEGDNWKLVQLSKTNSTFLNGQRIENDWYLQNGDEIQLAVNGPKIGFIVPSGNSADVKSLGMTQRLELFREQALSPYRTALRWTMVVALLGLMLVGYNLWWSNDIDKGLKDFETATAHHIADLNSRMDVFNDNLNGVKEDLGKVNGEVGALTEKLNMTVADLEEKVKAANSRAANAAKQAQKAIESARQSGAAPHAAIETIDKFVYFIECSHISVSDGQRTQNVECPFSGTGFMLNDGRFVTARHVAVPWGFNRDDQDFMELSLMEEAGYSVVAHFVAVSPKGDIIELKSSDFKINKSKDIITDVQGGRIRTVDIGDTDWATCIVKNRGGLSKDNAKSQSLKRGDLLHISGFPLGLGAESVNNINALYCTARVASDGIRGDGLIYAQDDNSEQGNSGGPVMVIDGSDNISVVGLVSGGSGNNTGFFVPICAIDR